MKLKKLAVVTATGLLATTLAAPARQAVAALELCRPNHCYGIANYQSGDITAVGVDLWTDCLHLDTPLSDVATHELWMHTNAVPGSVTWIEGGYIKGSVAGGDTENWFRWFWAEHNGTNFYSHFVQYGTVSQWKNISFYRNANNTWNIRIGGTSIGNSTTVATYGTHLQVGAETTEETVYSHGKSKLIQWRQPAGTWTNAGPSSSAGTAGVYSVTASGRDLEQTSLQNMCSPAPLAAKQTVKAPTEADLKAAALSVAAAHGEPSPTGLQVVSATRKVVQRAVGAGEVDSDQAAYLVQMTGAFVGRAPQGARLPRGTSMTVTVDAKTGEVTDTSLGHDRRDLKKLGAVKAL